MVASAIGGQALEGAEPLLERLDLPEAALANLARLAGVGEEAFACAGGWAARVELAGTALLVRGDETSWALLLPPGADDDDAMLTARKLHALLGEQADGWDLDR